LEYNPSDEEHREIMEYLISEGAAILEGIDEDGEPIYVFDMEVLEEVMPELHQVMQQDMDQVLVDLYQKGLIDVSYDENLNAMMTISEEGKVQLLEAGFNLNHEEDIL
jgi:Tfp pilus assembly ATPase PilU